MKIVTNQEIIENRAKWARFVTPLTMVLLVGALITNFWGAPQSPIYLQITMVLMGLGLISAVVSSHLVNNWVREPRADQVLEFTLKKFSNDFALFNYTTNLRHILITPTRVYVIIIKRQDGKVAFDGKRFYREWSWKRVFRLLADEGLGVPLKEAERGVQQLRDLLAARLDEEDMPELAALILFTHKDVNLTVKDPPIPIMTTKELKSYLRDNEKTRNISNEQRKTLTELFS